LLQAWRLGYHIGGNFLLPPLFKSEVKSAPHRFTKGCMAASAQPVSLPIRFSVFELDQKTGELRKNGLKQRIERQPVQILTLLLEKAGAVVSREELKRKLWADDINVDFEHGINTSVRRLREVLGDCAETPRFIETLPRRGYRFIYPLNHAVLDVQPPERRRKWVAGFTVCAAILVVTATISIYRFWLDRHKMPQIASLAVLPLVDVSGDASQEYFADGMTDELITNVSKIPNLRVISRTSVMQYKGALNTKKGLSAIAHELNVDGVIEGTVLRSGNRVRIAVQFIDAASDTHIWAETYERDLRDVMAIQDEVTLAIAHEIRAALRTSNETQVARRRAIDPRAFELYLKGRHYFNNRLADKAAASFIEAIKLQPDYAEAYAGLGGSLNLLQLANAAEPQNSVPQGKAAALRALEIDDSVGDAHVALGWAKMTYDWDWAGAELEFRRALVLNSNDPTAHLWYGCELIWEKAIRRRACRNEAGSGGSSRRPIYHRVFRNGPVSGSAVQRGN
jgi:TolB-like protein/DNA-binding winged helix-turn-helix (wHTH) protein